MIFNLRLERICLNFLSIILGIKVGNAFHPTAVTILIETTRNDNNNNNNNNYYDGIWSSVECCREECHW